MTVAFIGGTSTLVVAFLFLSQRQPTPSRWSAAILRLLNRSNKSMVIAVEKEGAVVFDCLVCLCEVSQEEEYRKLPNCNHGVQFHAHCIDAWLRNHSSCPMCRSNIPRSLSQSIKACVQHLLEEVITYSNSALDNVASSIGDCRDF
ncbi:RING-H2 finger protein ATL13 [Lactuca sativa]|uniref:RING-H2 finger protein ATL13 n=1 Tax=Lactuca sativa TaxID=4236 RepID=UPI000CD89A35|nr:RING-H2 finger protein ATL13 [Lactuca sativa]